MAKNSAMTMDKDQAEEKCIVLDVARMATM